MASDFTTHLPTPSVPPLPPRFALPMPYAGSFILMCGLHCLHILVTLAIDYKLLHRLASEQHQAAPQQLAKGKDSEQQPGDSKSALVLQEAAGDGSSMGSQAEGVVVQVAEDKAAALEEPPMISYRALLLTHEFIVPALTAGLSFCSMAALMSVTPIAMRVRGRTHLTDWLDTCMFARLTACLHSRLPA
jgi:hypothetical protein